MKTRKDGRLIVVIRYFHPGNYVGEEVFRNNVLLPRDLQPTTKLPPNTGIALNNLNFALFVFDLVMPSTWQIFCRLL